MGRKEKTLKGQRWHQLPNYSTSCRAGIYGRSYIQVESSSSTYGIKKWHFNMFLFPGAAGSSCWGLSGWQSRFQLIPQQRQVHEGPSQCEASTSKHRKHYHVQTLYDRVLFCQKISDERSHNDLASVMVDDEALVPAVEVFVGVVLHSELLQHGLIGALAHGMHRGAHIIQDAHNTRRILEWQGKYCQNASCLDFI